MVPTYFRSRDRELTALTQAEGPTTVAALGGIGGVGKSQVASRFFDQACNGFDVAVWLNAELDGGVADLVAAARTAGLEPLEGEAPEATITRFWQAVEIADRSLLVVFDNALEPHQVRDLLPRSRRARVVITSRHTNWTGTASTITVGPLDPAEGGALLQEVAGRPDDPASESLSNALGGLPLALVLAGSRCRHGRTFANFETDWRARLDFAELSAGTDVAYRRTVHAIWRDSLSAAAARTSIATTLLAVMARLDWRAINRRWFTDALVATEVLGDGAAIDAALEALADVSLIVLTAEQVEVQHGLIADGVRSEPADGLVIDPDDLFAMLLYGSLPEDPQLGWNSDADEAVNHLYAAAGRGAPLAEQQLRIANSYVVRLLYRYDQHRYLAIAERVAIDLPHVLGPDTLETLVARGNLAAGYQLAGRIGDAIKLKEQVLADFERVFGLDDPATITARGNLARSYQADGRTDGAIKLREQVLADSERILGPDDPATLAARGNLAVSYWNDGRNADAIALEEQVLADRERILGRDHPDTLNTRGNLAISFWSEGRVPEAITLLEEVTADRERILGRDHPDTLTTQSSLATCYQSVGRGPEAITLQEAVLAALERVLGYDHPETLTTRNNLAGSYYAVGRQAEAIILYEEVLAGSERVLGADHSDTTSSRRNLAGIYQVVGRTAEAVVLRERILHDLERRRGADHPDTADARSRLAAARAAVDRQGP